MKKSLIACGVALLLAGCNTPDDNKKEIDNLKDQITELQTLTDQVKTLEMDVDRLKSTSTNTANMDKINAKIASLEDKISSLETKVNNSSLGYIVIKPTTLITTTNAKVYSAPSEDSEVIDEWAPKTTFTSYKEKNNFVKVTGYFVDNKWTQNTKEWWIKKSDAKIKILAQ
ncbi:MAG: hypothetical protein GXO40_04425 [Epsilonproteobacteria bacterium]|nr:hypothetical protein [Campylobacterota bacterium]